MLLQVSSGSCRKSDAVLHPMRPLSAVSAKPYRCRRVAIAVGTTSGAIRQLPPTKASCGSLGTELHEN